MKFRYLVLALLFSNLTLSISFAGDIYTRTQIKARKYGPVPKPKPKPLSRAELREKLSNEFDELGSLTLNSKKEYENYKEKSKKLMFKLGITQSQLNDPLLKAVKWHDFNFLRKLLEEKPFMDTIDLNFKSFGNPSAQEFLNALKRDTNLISKYNYNPNEVWRLGIAFQEFLNRKMNK